MRSYYSGFLKTVLATACVTALATSAHAERSERYSGTFTADHNAPTKASGKVDTLFYPAAHVLRYTASWKDLSGPMKVAHFQGPAAENKKALPFATVHQTTPTSMSGSLLLTPQQEELLRNGKVYLNLQTTAYPNGEVKAQLTQ